MFFISEENSYNYFVKEFLSIFSFLEFYYWNVASSNFLSFFFSFSPLLFFISNFLLCFLGEFVIFIFQSFY